MQLSKVTKHVWTITIQFNRLSLCVWVCVLTGKAERKKNQSKQTPKKKIKSKWSNFIPLHRIRCSCWKYAWSETKPSLYWKKKPNWSRKLPSSILKLTTVYNQHLSRTTPKKIRIKSALRINRSFFAHLFSFLWWNMLTAHETNTNNNHTWRKKCLILDELIVQNNARI